MSKTTELKNFFLSHRHVTNDLISRIQAGHYSYKPAPTSMSAKELVVHMLVSFHMFASAAAGKNSKPIHEKHEEDDLVKLSEKYTEEAVKLLDGLSDERLSDMIDMTDILGTEMPVKAVINTAVIHEIHHKGNLFVYVREMGHTDLPLFVKI